MLNCEHSTFKVTPLNRKTIALQLIGNFHKHVTHRLRKEIMSRLKEQNVVVDLSRVNDIDTSGTALLVECFRISETTNTTFKVVGINRKVKSIFEIRKLSTIFSNLNFSLIPHRADHVLYRSRIV